MLALRLQFVVQDRKPSVEGRGLLPCETVGDAQQFGGLPPAYSPAAKPRPCWPLFRPSACCKRPGAASGVFPNRRRAGLPDPAPASRFSSAFRPGFQSRPVAAPTGRRHDLPQGEIPLLHELFAADLHRSSPCSLPFSVAENFCGVFVQRSPLRLARLSGLGAHPVPAENRHNPKGSRHPRARQVLWQRESVKLTDSSHHPDSVCLDERASPQQDSLGQAETTPGRLGLYLRAISNLRFPATFAHLVGTMAKAGAVWSKTGLPVLFSVRKWQKIRCWNKARVWPDWVHPQKGERSQKPPHLKIDPPEFWELTEEFLSYIIIMIHEAEVLKRMSVR